MKENSKSLYLQTNLSSNDITYVKPLAQCLAHKYKTNVFLKSSCFNKHIQTTSLSLMTYKIKNSQMALAWRSRLYLIPVHSPGLFFLSL